MSEGEQFMPEGEQSSEKSGMSSTAKVIIGIIAASVLTCAVCCGGVFWWFSQRVSTDPAKVREMTESIVSIDIPAGWQPVMGMNWSLGAQMEFVVYSPDQTNQSRLLVLMEMQVQGANQQQMEQQMQMQMSQQGMNQDITVESSETRTFTIDGEEHDFVFAVGKNSAGDTVHQVTGVFPGKNGTAMLMMIDDDADWDEAAVVKMIESISTQ